MEVLEAKRTVSQLTPRLNLDVPTDRWDSAAPHFCRCRPESGMPILRWELGIVNGGVRVQTEKREQMIGRQMGFILRVCAYAALICIAVSTTSCASDAGRADRRSGSLVQMGLDAAVDGDYDRSLQLLDDAIRESPWCSEALFARGFVLSLTDEELAERDMRHAIEIDGDSLSARIEYSRVLVDLDRLEDAERVASHVIAASGPRRPIALYWRAVARMRMNDVLGAIDDMTLATEVISADPEWDVGGFREVIGVDAARFMRRVGFHDRADETLERLGLSDPRADNPLFEFVQPPSAIVGQRIKPFALSGPDAVLMSSDDLLGVAYVLYRWAHTITPIRVDQGRFAEAVQGVGLVDDYDVVTAVRAVGSASRIRVLSVRFEPLVDDPLIEILERSDRDWIVFHPGESEQDWLSQRVSTYYRTIVVDENGVIRLAFAERDPVRVAPAAIGVLERLQTE